LQDEPPATSQTPGRPIDAGSFLVCPIDDWPTRDRGWTLAFPLVVAVVVYAVIFFWLELSRAEVPLGGILATGSAAIVVTYAIARAVWRRGAMAEARARRAGAATDRLRARERLAQLRGRRGWARLARDWPGPRVILIGLRPDRAGLAEVQVFEPIDVSVSPRDYASLRVVKYREIHVTAVVLAMLVAAVAQFVLGVGIVTWVLWFLPMLPVAWALVWFYRRRRISSLAALAPIQLLSTVVEPGRVTRTVFGLTRVHEADSGLLIVRAMSASPNRHRKAQPNDVPVRLTLVNARGQRSSITVRGVDHPTIADVMARWAYRADKLR